ncbi:MAG TPA: glycoside hydrolase family 15 protein [Acidimicrobiales bacterium]|nr:glycoside hydrolase family 15 protein [Acidimicrobiales bacterium]
MTRADRDIPPPHVLREYSLVADGERGALIGPRGEIAWLCVPAWGDDAVFSSLIGGPGTYSVTPVERFVWGGYYEQDTLIWRSRWVTVSGVVECREALTFPAERDRAVLLRRVVAHDGDARVKVVFEPRAGFGSDPLTDLKVEHGIWTARTGGLKVRWQGAGAARPCGERGNRRLELELVVADGTHHDLVLELACGALPEEPVDSDQAWAATEAAWSSQVPRLDSCLGPSDARRSYAVLRGMTSSSGGMVAAATTSLPERAEAGRNYDYRYVWIRDQSYAGHAMAAAGDERLLTDAIRFVSERLLEHGPKLAPAYTATGAPVPDQRQLGLPGYPGGFDQVGNWVNKQFQLDAFGEALLLLAEGESCGVLDSEGWRALETAAAAVAERWQEPDAGIWEIDDRPWTHSRLIASAGLRAAARVAPRGQAAVEWLALADRILADTSARAVHRDGHWMRSPDDDGLDGSLLMVALRGAVAPDDPRTKATLAAYQRELTQDGYAYRFRQGPGPLGEAEGSFSLCGFVMAMVCLQQGDPVSAVAWYERIKSACGPPMLYSEEYDVGEHQMRGNLPQAFVHAVMLEASARLAGLPMPTRQ